MLIGRAPDYWAVALVIVLFIVLCYFLPLVKGWYSVFFQPDDFEWHDSDYNAARKWETDQHEAKVRAANKEDHTAKMEMNNVAHFLSNIPDRGEKDSGLYFDPEVQAIGVPRHGQVINMGRPNK